MKLYYSLFIFILFIFSISCEKDSFYEEHGDGDLLKSVLIDGEIYEEYTYNNAGLILEEKSKYHYTKYTYNGKNQLIQSEYYWDSRMASSSSYVLEEAAKRTEWVSPENTERNGYFNFEYNKYGRLEKRINTRLNGDYQSYDNFSYDENGRIEKRTSYHEGKVSVIDDYYYDKIGNLIKEQRYQMSESGNPELQTTSKYEFDNKHNPYLSFRGLMIPGQNTNPNNILKKIYTLHFEVDDFIDQILITEDRYEYNSKGYPIKRNESFEYIYY